MTNFFNGKIISVSVDDRSTYLRDRGPSECRSRRPRRGPWSEERRRRRSRGRRVSGGIDRASLAGQGGLIQGP